MITRGPIGGFVEVPFSPVGTLFSVELQHFHAHTNPVALVKLQHTDDSVELFVDRSLGWTEHHVRSDPAFGHLALRRLVQTDLSSASLESSADRVEARLDLAFDEGRELALRLRSQRRRPAPPMFTPAPPQDQPSTLRLLHMDAFWLLRAAHTDVELTLDGRSVQPVRLGHPRSPWLSARVGTGLDLSGINVANPRPDFGPSQRFQVVGDADSDEFVINGPLGCVVTGRVDDQCVDFRQCWSPGIRRPAGEILARVRSHRRRHEHWRWCGDDPASGQWSAR